MRNIICLFALVSVFYAAKASMPEAKTDTTVVAQAAPKIIEGASIDFGKVTEYDFGKIQENGGKKVGYLTFKNAGNRPLVITKVMVSCTCTTLDYPKKPILPGAEGKITITYNPKKQKGVFHKAIQIYSNDSVGRHIVFIKGEVVQ